MRSVFRTCKYATEMSNAKRHHPMISASTCHSYGSVLWPCSYGHIAIFPLTTCPDAKYQQTHLLKDCLD